MPHNCHRHAIDFHKYQNETPMNKPLNIALAGLGTVGVGVIQLLHENEDIITKRAGRPIRITSVSARDRNKDRGVDLSNYRWVNDMSAMAGADDIDIVVELVGGSDGPALSLARSALSAGKSLVTANKAMVAHHGFELAQLGEGNECTLKYEAAVAGAIPIIKGLRDGAAGNRIDRVYGILNGTCNYILSAMESDSSDFADVLSAAQARGYAEADPSFDIDGVDAAHKLAILASLCFGTKINFEAVETYGIRGLMAPDIRQAAVLGYNIRLLGLAEVDNDKQALFQRVQPYLVKRDHPLANVIGPTNAVVAEGNYSGRLLFQGAGAGDKPTASAVVADIIDLARGDKGAVFGMPCEQLREIIVAQSGDRIGKSYIRIMVADKPGVLAEIAAVMRDANVSIESLIQQDAGQKDGEALIAMVTHNGPESAITQTIETLSNSDNMVDDPMVMHILGD